MKALVKEFKEFISKGDVMSMAVGIIIGGAFTAIVNSVVADIISPLLGLICGGMDFTQVGFSVGDAFFGVGNLINAIITFLLTALVLFFILKGFNEFKTLSEKALKKEEAPAEPEAAPEPSEEVKLLTEIRDALKK